MITQQMETVLREFFHQDVKGKQKYKKKVSEQKESLRPPAFLCEWKKARSRVAARRRREKESQLFREITALLPLAPNTEAQLDKASVIRLTIAYLHLRALLDNPESSAIQSTKQHSYLSQGESVKLNEKWFLDCALGGFLMLLSINGKIIFTTKDVYYHTGINQMDLIGRSLFDFIHPSDQKEVKEILTKLIGSQEQQECDIFIRIKGTGNQRMTPWKVIYCTGVIKSSFAPGSSCLLLLCRSLPGQEVIEMQAHLNFKTFLSIHGLDMKFTYCKSGVLELTGFRDTELHGQSVYQYYHPSDCQHILKAHLCLLSKGQVHTGKYRLLQKHGGYVWAETDATVMYNIHTGQPESVMCINYILSGVELPDVVFSIEQTGCLLTPTSHDSCRPEIHSIPAPFPTALQNVPNQARSTTVGKHTSHAVSCRKRVRTANAYTEIRQETAVCDSLTCDICALDLDSLAPYIPMDGEDFLLPPVLDGLVEKAELNRYWPPLSRPQLTLDPDLYPPLETNFPATNGILFTLQHTDSYFSLSNRVSKGPELISSRQGHGSQHEVYKKQEVVPNCQVPSLLNKTNHWRTGTTKSSQHLSKSFWKIYDGTTACNYCPSNPEAPRYAKVAWHPPEPFSPHFSQCNEEKTLQTSVSVPVLNRWECEMNAPLEPASNLLQGNDFTSILDQVISGVSWN